MRDRYLLYIDILGFSHHVRKGTLHVQRIYNIIEELNAHHHDAFKVIVFSDTVLIYNNAEPLTNDDRNYYVMFLIEFAQNLLYEFAGKKLFFRAVLVHGEFEHTASKKFEKYFGKALVRAYGIATKIKGCGLFIDNKSQKNNKVFPVRRHDRDVSFVYLNQSLDHFYDGELGSWPVDPDLMFQTDSQWHLAKDIYFLRDVFTLMKKHADAGVRLKMKTTWGYYLKRYPNLLRDLADGHFNLSILSNGFDWSDPVSRITEGYKGFSKTIPSLDKLRDIVKEAKQCGSLAAKKSFKAIYGENKPGEKFYAPCGGGIIILDIDGRSRLSRLLVTASQKLDDFFFSKAYHGGYTVSIRGMHSCQEREVDVAASKAALEVLQERLGVTGHVEEYYD